MNDQTEFPLDRFETDLVAGNLKAAMKNVQAPSRDLWQVPIGDLHIMPNFNVRVKDEAHKAHIRALANSMKSEGYYQDKPLACYVARTDGKQTIYITDGHCRLEGALLAVSEGAEILHIPVVPPPKGTSLEDLTVALVKSNSGKPLSPYEVGVVCKRLVRYGWNYKQIAARLDYTETYISGLLSLMAAPIEIRDMVQAGHVSASMAITALQGHGDKAVTVLRAGIAKASEAGAVRVTARHLPGAQFKQAIKKAAPAMFDLLREIQADILLSSGFDPQLLTKLCSMIELLEALRTPEESDAHAA